MDNQNTSDIAAFPELFDGLDQFIEEEAGHLIRTSAVLALAIAVPGAALFYLASSVA